MKKKLFSLFLALCMTITLLPANVLAAEPDALHENEAQTDGQGGIVYSDAALRITAESYLEEGKSYPVTLTRGDAADEAKFTVVLYDNSANYDADYRVLVNGEAVDKISGAQSVYDAFRENGTLTDGLAFALAVAEALADGEQDESAEDVSAAAAFAQLDELDAKAAEFTVTFAAGVHEVELTLEVLDDAEAEYEETFLMAVLDEDGEVIEGAQQAFAILDNDSPAPTVTVDFDCADEMALTDENEAVELTLRRSGALATTTIVTVYVDGAAYGKVDFTPWQEVQTFDAVIGGVYTIDGSTTGVEVIDSTTSELTVAEGADPVLDAIPEEYAVIRTPRQKELDNTSWLPGWATGQETTNEKQTIYLGSATGNNLFHAGGNDSKGSVTFFVDGLNVHEVSTSGDGSYVSTGELWADSNKSYDFTGVESVESTVYVDGVDHEANISIGVHQTVDNVLNITEDGTYTIKSTLPDKFQGTKYVYYHNEDPSGWCGGTNMFVPNGFKMNLRVYRFRISVDPTEVDPDGKLTYYGASESGIQYIPGINSTKAVQYVTINSKEYGTTNTTVDIVYESQLQYPAKLVGYRLSGNGKTSDVIPLTLDASAAGSKAGGSAGTAHITFDVDFLKKYENDYCYKENYNLDGEYWTFKIIPVYEKISVSEITYRASELGTIGTVDSVKNQSHIGDRLVIEAKTKAEGVELCGVWYQATDWQSDKYIRQMISQTRYTEDKPWYLIDLEYPIYTLEGIFSTDATRLMVAYTYGADAHGTLQTTLNGKGEAVSAEQYVVGDYVTLMAKPDEGYVTRWRVKSQSEYYYGNVFNYQLDGHPDHNLIYVEFVKPGESETSPTVQTTNKLTGTLVQAYVEARKNGSTSWLNMANTEISVYADQTYTAVTDANGSFTINNFTGVVGGTYSVSVPYNDSVGYTTFTYTPDEPLELKMHQFPTDVPYPDNVIADVNGQGSNENYLTLTSSGTVNAKARVYVPTKDYEITGVKFYFVNPQLAVKGMSAVGTKTYDAIAGEVDGDYQYWSIAITDASELTSGMHLYVEVLSEKTVYQNAKDGSSTAYKTAISTGMVDTGYALTTANREDEFTVSYDIPSTPNMSQINWYTSGDRDKLEIPVIGKLDFSVTSKTGGFFAQSADAEGNTTLVCGSSYLAYYGTGTISQKVDQMRKTDDALTKAEEEGAANADMTAVSGFAKVSSPSQFTITPAFLFRFTLSPTSDGSSVYLSSYEMALGFDASYIRNIPFSVYGVPFYVCLSFTTEMYFDLAAEYAESTGLTMEKVNSDLLFEKSIKKLNALFAAPLLKFTIKGGVGYNAFLSLYLSASVDAPFVVSFIPSYGLDGQAAMNLSFTVAGGADLVLFTGEVSKKLDVTQLGNANLQEQLKLITAKYAAASTSAQSLRSAFDSADDLDYTDYMDSVELDELMNEMTFAPMLRTALRRAVTQQLSDGTIAENVFKNTGIHLLKLSEENILAFYLKDTKVEDTLNYLTITYAESTDGGETWEEKGYLSDNTQKPRTSLQYDVNLFDLGDRTLVTWSEANFDEVLKNLNDVDIDHLTPAQIAKFMNAMDLKGCFYDPKTGKFGEAFTIAENSTVACGALDAVKNGDMVYVYYQRNIFPYDETDGTVTLEQLLSTDRTIAMARADVNDTENWTSTTVRATKNGTEQEYRITEVEPFVHDGVMGEILELDRDGRLAIWDETNEAWEPSNEDRQLYLRTYTFDTDGTPIPSALMAITDPTLCARSPQVVSNDDYLHLFWNQNGKIVYLVDFVATSADNEYVRKGAYVVVDDNGNASVVDANRNQYYANDIASDEHFHIGTTFTASMDDAGSVLLSWVATDTDSAELTDEIYGVVLDTVTNAEAVKRSGSKLTGSEDVYQLYAKGSPVALTDDAEDEKSLIGALDSVFIGTDNSSNSNFLLAYSKLNDVTRENATSADIKAQQSVYNSNLEITAIDAPAYPMPGSDMTVAVTVTNRGLGEATNVAVSASGVGDGASGKIDSILPGRSETIELTVAVPASFNETATMTVTADNVSESVDVLYGAHFLVKYMPEMANLIGSSDYTTVTQVTNAGNAAGIPTLNYEVGIFADDETSKEYSYTASEEVPAGGIAYLSYVLEDTPVTADATGMLTVRVDVGEDELLDAYQYIQGRMPKCKTLITKSDLKLDSTGDGNDEDDDLYIRPSKPAETEPETKQPVSFTDVPVGSWYEEAVKWAVEQGITKGTGDGTTFSPDLDCDRAQAVTFLWRAAGSPAPQSREMPFVDVPADAWYREAVLWAVEQGITKGTGDGTTFSPELACDRAQIVTMIYRLEQANGGGFTGAWAMRLPFSDTPDWAYEAIAWCYMKGITKGTGDGSTFSPYLACSRAQIVTMLHRYADI